ILNLAAGSTISGTVAVSGGMNLFGPPPGSTATVCTIAQGNFTLFGSPANSALLNLNTATLNVANGNVEFSFAAVSTFVAYGAQPTDEVRMGNITASGTVTFLNTNTLTQGATGTPKPFELPLITCTGLIGDFTVYVLSDGVTHPPNAGNTIKLKRL